jgi:hypothetical protein
LLALSLSLVGCQPSRIPAFTQTLTITVQPQEVQVRTVDAPDRDQDVTLTINVEAGKGEAFIVVGAAVEQIQQLLTDDKQPGKLPEHAAMMGKQEVTQSATFTFRVPKQTEYSLLLRNRTAESVVVRVYIRGEFK